MKICYHGATTMTSDLETDISTCKAVGLNSMEVWAEKVDTYLSSHSMSELKLLFTDNKIQAVALDALVFIGFRGDDYPQIQRRCHILCEIARSISCPTIVVVPSPLPNREITWGEVVNEYVNVLQDLGEIADGYGVRLAFEFLGMGWASVRTPRGAWEIVQKVSRENVGMVIDTAHFYGGGGLLSELDLLDPNRIFALHLDDLEDTPKEACGDSTRLFPGEGIVPLHEICSHLSNLGYNGHCSVELFRPEYWQQNPSQIASKALESAKKILKPYFRTEL